MNSRTRDEMLADAVDNLERINWMNENLEGCDWCCGGGEEELAELYNELAAIKTHLHVTQEELETLCGTEIK